MHLHLAYRRREARSHTRNRFGFQPGVLHLEERKLLTNGAPLAPGAAFCVVHDRTVGGALEGYDPDDDPVTFNLVSGASHGNLNFSVFGFFTYTPNSEFVGRDTFTFSVSDGTKNSESATVTIDVENQAPVANGGRYSVLHDQSLQGGTASFSDADEDYLHLIKTDDTANGQLILYADGTFNYTPNPGFVGQDSFTYHVNDGVADSNSATITIDVINHEPLALNQEVNLAHDTSASGNLTFTDTDNDSVNFSTMSLPTHGTLELDTISGSFTYTPEAGFHGPDSFTYRVHDGAANSNTATIFLSVSPYPLTITSTKSVTWDYTGGEFSNWAGGHDSANISISAVTHDGRTFEGPPIITSNYTTRTFHDETIISSGDSATYFTEHDASGNLIQGYRAIIDIKWTYSRVAVLSWFTDYVPEWIDRFFGGSLTITIHSKLTVTIRANGNTSADPPINTSDTPDFYVNPGP